MGDQKKLAKMDLFHTPKDSAELLDYIAGMSGSERVTATIVMGMTWNLVCSIIDRSGLLEIDEPNRG